MFGLALASTILISGGRASAEELGLLLGRSAPVEDLPPKPKVEMRRGRERLEAACGIE